MVESASRSLEKPTPQKIEQLVTDLISQRIADGQLDECDLTLAELNIIAERFRFTLMTMLHTRIAYPKQDTKITPMPRRVAAAGCDGRDAESRIPRRRSRPPDRERGRARAVARMGRGDRDRAWVRA